MNQDKREKPSKQGWTVGSVAEFLQLTPTEATYLELKLAFDQQLEVPRQPPQLTSSSGEGFSHACGRVLTLPRRTPLVHRR